MTEHPADPPSTLTAEEIEALRYSIQHRAFWAEDEPHTTYATTIARLLATLDAARAPDAGLRAALVLLRRSVEGRCGNPLCPSAHVNWGEDCIEFALSHVESAALASSPAPAGLDERVLGALRDAAEQAHGFMHYGPFTDCEAAICVQRFKLSRAALASSPAPAGPEERKALFEAGRATGTVEGWADYTHDDEYDALARQLHESIAEGQSVADTAKALRLLAPAPAGLDEERLADWMMDHLPEYHRWMTTGWRDTMRDEAVVLARDMIRAATRPAEDDHGWEAYKDAFPAGKNIVESPRPAEDAGERP